MDRIHPGTIVGIKGSGSGDWARVRQVFEAALALPADQRLSFVADTCADEPAVQDQVVGLLASHAQADTFLETPAVNLLEDLLQVDLTGENVGPYRVESRIGRGGMGDVYRARDTRLERTVAIKVLQSTAVDQSRRERLQREARAIAALNHPNICTLYDVGSHAGLDFLVMEFLEGETLAARLERGSLPMPQALQFAIEIASALDRAHRGGIVHRDLKPRNIMLARSGVGSSIQSKLLDFGLAKTTTAAIVGPLDGALAADLTAPGTILGTLHYMAPEQLEGRSVDARTDLFAFGCVLYEMVTGKKAFDARSSASLLTAIMAHRPTPIRELQPGVPPGIEYVIARCLEKDPDDRWQTARDLLAELQRTSARDETAVARPHGSSWRLRGVAAALVAAAVIGAFVVTPLMRRTSTPQGTPTWLSILPPTNGFDQSPASVVSPDGRFVVFKARNDLFDSVLWVKDLRGPAARPLPGTEGVTSSKPFWSPDGRSIGFFARNQLKRVDIEGGTPQVLARANEPRGGAWTASGAIIFMNAAGQGYWVPASGGSPALVPGSGPGQVRLFPHALPDGRHYLFTSRNVNGLGQGIYVASLDDAEVQRVSDAWSEAVYANGQLLFGRQGALFAQPFDPSRRATTGDPQHLADGIAIGCCTPLSFEFSASANVLTFWSGVHATAKLQWIGRNGTPLASVDEAESISGVAQSPDGRSVVVERLDATSNSPDLWLLDPTGGSRTSRLTVDGNATNPVWSPDGTRLVVMYRGRGLVEMNGRGGGTRTIVADPKTMWPTDWSPDGQHIAFADAQTRLLTVPANGQAAPSVYRQGPFWLGLMRFFPVGGWVAYVSFETGQPEVYVDSFPVAGQKIRISTDRGSWPVWRRDGRELYYLAADRSLMAVAIQSESGTVRASAPVRLFEAPQVNSDWSKMQFAPNADGSQFLFNARVEDKTPVGLTVVANWSALLK